jgi:hypothetical protein
VWLERRKVLLLPGLELRSSVVQLVSSSYTAISRILYSSKCNLIIVFTHIVLDSFDNTTEPNITLRRGQGPRILTVCQIDPSSYQTQDVTME